MVLLLTNGPDGEPYESVFHRQAGQGWAEVSGSNGYGWHSYGDGERGFATYWDETTLTERVTVSYRDTAKTVPVVSGYFLAVFWDDVSGDDSVPVTSRNGRRRDQHERVWQRQKSLTKLGATAETFEQPA
ncbi:MAG: hypothetical protein ABSF03_05565 [Streptosporangiaceae bacterium]